MLVLSLSLAGIRYATRDGKVKLNTVEYTNATAFLNSDWLYFLWHDIKIDISPDRCAHSNRVEHSKIKFLSTRGHVNPLYSSEPAQVSTYEAFLLTAVHLAVSNKIVQIFCTNEW